MGKIKDTYVSNRAKSPIVQKIQQTLMDIDGIRPKLKRTRHFHLIFVGKILSYNFILITTRLPALSVTKRNRD